MRITEGRIASDFLFSVNRTRASMNKLQTQLATGKRIQKPSDDPEATDIIMRLNNSVEKNAQFQKNLADGQSALEMTAESLDSFAGMLSQVQEILAGVTNGTRTDSYGTVADQLEQLLNQGLAAANTKFNEKYLFGGTQTQTVPYVLVDNATPPPSQTVTYNGNGSSISFQIGEGVNQKVNMSGQEAFNGTAIFDKLIQIKDALRAGTAPSAGDADAIIAMHTSVLQAGSTVGAFLQNLDSTSTHLSEQRTQLLSLLSVQQDTDVAEATMNLKQQELMLNAALNTGAQILPKSLVDFMT